MGNILYLLTGKVRECCSHEYFGYMAGATKDLFDRTYKNLKDDIKIHKKTLLHYNQHRQRQLRRSYPDRTSIQRLSFKKVQHPIICKGPVTEEILAECYELGMTIAEGIYAGIF